jgi:hypothetical protein
VQQVEAWVGFPMLQFADVWLVATNSCRQFRLAHTQFDAPLPNLTRQKLEHRRCSCLFFHAFMLSHSGYTFKFGSVSFLTTTVVVRRTPILVARGRYVGNISCTPAHRQVRRSACIHRRPHRRTLRSVLQSSTSLWLPSPFRLGECNRPVRHFWKSPLEQSRFQASSIPHACHTGTRERQSCRPDG